MRKQSVGKMWKTKEWKECEKFKWKFFGKKVEKICVEKTWINDLEEVKSVKKCQCGKKRDKFPWKNITYLVVVLVTSCVWWGKCGGWCWSHPWQLASEKLGCSCVHHNFCRCTCLFLSIPAFDSLQLLSVGIMIHESIFRLCGWCSWATNSTIEGSARWNWRPSCAVPLLQTIAARCLRESKGIS